MAHYKSGYFESLVDDLGTDIATSRSPRVIVPVCHIYLEHIMEILLTSKYEDAGNFISKNGNGFEKKMHKLAELQLLSLDEHHDLEIINTIRNRFTHNLKLNLNEVHKMMIDLKFHNYNENVNPVKAILDSILHLMEVLEEKIID